MVVRHQAEFIASGGQRVVVEVRCQFHAAVEGRAGVSEGEVVEEVWIACGVDADPVKL